MRAHRRSKPHAALCLLLAFATARGARPDAPPSAGMAATPEPARAPQKAAQDGWLASVEADITASEYEITWQPGSAAGGRRPNGAWQASNRAQGFVTEFTADGILLHPFEAAAGWDWGLSLLRYGRAGAMRGAEAAPFAPAKNRAERARAGLVEWYLNDGRGLEQGFTLTSPPPHQHAGEADEILIEQSIAGPLSPSFSEDGSSVTFRPSRGNDVLRYGDLEVVDARGVKLPARMEGFAEEGVRGLRLRIDDAGAVYPITVDPLTSIPDWYFSGELANEALGLSVATAGDVNGDGYSDVVIGAMNYSHGQQLEGKVYLFLGSASGLPYTPAWSVESNLEYAYFGSSVASAGDVNGDGYDDVIIGALGCCSGALSPDGGAAYVYLGSPAGLSTTPAWFVKGNGGPLAQFGNSVASAGDVNGDGFADVLVGDPGYGNGETDEGRAVLFLGSPSGLATTVAWSVEGNLAFDLLGQSVAGAGDVNGDGFADVIVGAYGYQSYLGQAHVYLGSASGLATSPAWTATGDQAAAQFGRNVAGAGDVNGDGYADVAVAAPAYDTPQANGGRVFVYLGSASGPAATPVWTWSGSQANETLGVGLATAGDVNGDGYADLLVGAPGYSDSQASEGTALLFFGSAAGPDQGFWWSAEGGQASADYGWAVATAGDVNGDGYSDLLVGSPYYDSTGVDQGRAYAYYGSPYGPNGVGWEAVGPAANAQLGASLAFVDVNGDGYSDLLAGAPHYSSGAGEVGRAVLYYGSPAGLAASPGWSKDGDQVGAQFGAAVASAGDVNGDGYADVVIGAPFYTNGQLAEGRVSVFLGSAAGLATTPVWVMESDHSQSHFGTAVAGAGDIDGDGFGDLLIGAPDDGTIGRAVLYSGSAAGPQAQPSWTTDGLQAGYAHVGASVAGAGDLNGDGFPDILIGAPGNYSGSPSVAGHVLVVQGSTHGLENWYYLMTGEHFSDGFGFSVAGAGDVNGDGLADILVGAPFAWTDGRAYVYLGASVGGFNSSPVFSTVTESSSPSPEIGYSVASAGDVDGDGYSDLIVGKAFGSPGEVDVYRGSPVGPAAGPSWFLFAAQTGSRFGLAVAGAADVNGDGFSDIATGAPLFSAPGVADAGAVDLFYGGSRRGPDRHASQRRTDGVTPIPVVGRSDATNAFVLHGQGVTAAGRGRVRLQWEVEPLGTSFSVSGAGIGATPFTDSGAPVPGGGSAAQFNLPITGLTAATFQHWRVRTLSANPLFPRTPWRSLTENGPNQGKLRTAGCLDADGDGRGEPNDPFCASPIPDCDDQSAVAWSTPGEAANLRFTGNGTLVWDAPASPGAPAANLVYDTLRSAAKGDFLSGGTLCLESDSGPDTTTTDNEVPAVGQAFFYLVRAHDGCPNAEGPAGFDSAGNPIAARPCVPGP